jgi:hypothetical protein
VSSLEQQRLQEWIDRELESVFGPSRQGPDLQPWQAVLVDRFYRSYDPVYPRGRVRPLASN